MFTTPQNDMTIPAAMAPAMLYTGAITTALVPLVFASEAFRLQLRTVKSTFGPGRTAPDYGGLIFRTVLVVLGLGVFYKWLFLKAVAVCDFIAMTVENPEDWNTFLVQLHTTTSNGVSSSLLTLGLPGVASGAAWLVLSIAEDLFRLIRYVLLCLLYAIGPIAVASAISELGVRAFWSWLKTLWQVSFWAVVFALLQATFLALNQTALQDGTVGAVSAGVVYAIVLVALTFYIPTLTSAVFSSGNLGSLGEAVMAGIVSFKELRGMGISGGSSVGRALAGPKGLIRSLPAMLSTAAQRAAARSSGGGANPPPPPSAPPAGDSDRNR